jgi:hypothetical protein
LPKRRQSALLGLELISLELPHEADSVEWDWFFILGGEERSYKRACRPLLSSQYRFAHANPMGYAPIENQSCMQIRSYLFFGEEGRLRV